MMSRLRASRRSPTIGLVIGLLVTLAAVVADSWYMTKQIRGLRALQTDLLDRSRKDSLQLLRVQNDLNLVALAMRDMLDSDERYPHGARSQFVRRLPSDQIFSRSRRLGSRATGRGPATDAVERGVESFILHPLSEILNPQ